PQGCRHRARGPAHGGGDPVDDGARAHPSRDHRWRPPAPNRTWERPAAGGRQPRAEGARDDAEGSQAVWPGESRKQGRRRPAVWTRRFGLVKIRLRRMGAKKHPFYRLVVADSRSPRDGRFIEHLGYYDPMTDPVKVKIDVEKVERWL